MQNKVRFIVVDDHPIFRKGMIDLVQTNPRYQVVAEAGSMDEALSVLATTEVDVALVDISLQGQNGLELVKTIKSLYPSVQSLMISIYNESVYAQRALKAHARGYVMKQEAASVMLDAIRTVIEGKIYLSPSMQNRLLEQMSGGRGSVDQSGVDSLSDRELEVFNHIGRGYGASEIAEFLNLSVKTVNVYRDHIKEKLGIETAAELRRFAVQWVHTHEDQT